MTLRHRLESVARSAAFACTLVVGIAVGCLWNAVEVLEDKLKPGKQRTVAEKSQTPF